MPLRLVQTAMNARDDSAVGLFRAGALGWCVSRNRHDRQGFDGLKRRSGTYTDFTAKRTFVSA